MFAMKKRKSNCKTKQRIYEYLQEFIGKHGYSPSMQQIADALDLKNAAIAHYHIERLCEEGFISKDERVPRSITLRGRKMRNIDAFNAMSREGQLNMLEKYFYNSVFKGTELLVGETANKVSREMAEEFMEWLYSQAE